LTGTAFLTEEIRSGVVVFPLGFGYWANGSSEVVVNGKLVKGDKRRATPLYLTAAMATDPVTKNVTLT